MSLRPRRHPADNPQTGVSAPRRLVRSYSCALPSVGHALLACPEAAYRAGTTVTESLFSLLYATPDTRQYSCYSNLRRKDRRSYGISCICPPPGDPGGGGAPQGGDESRVKAPRAAPFIVPAFAASLAGLNWYFCKELFRIEYLDNFQSNEGVLATVAKFLTYHAGAKWFPLWNIGLPVENTYDPVVPAGIALLSWVTPLSAPLALHVLCGAFFCLIPVAWFWLMWRWGVSAPCAFAAGILYSLVSPSLFSLHDLGGIMDSRRLVDVVHWGDIAHMAATGFLPLALFAIERAARTGRTRYFLGAIPLSALTCLSDKFGITALSLCTLALLASLDAAEMRKCAIRAALIGAATYLCVCRILTPALLALVSRNSQMLSGDYRFSKLTLVGWGILLAGGAAVRAITSRARFAVRFAALMAWIFTAIYALYFLFHIPILPVTERYDLEVDLSVSILAAICVWQLPVRLRRVLLAAALVAAVPQAIKVRRAARDQLKTLDVFQTAEYQGSRWIGQNLPGVRIMVGGDATYWFDYWTDNPQLSGGHDGLAPNIMQRIAVYTIYTGENAGDRDALYSIFWMKAFGVGAIYVAGSRSSDKIHPFVHPEKFAGVLTTLWRDGDTAIYASANRSRSLAHVIPASAVVAKQPANGLDIRPAEPYVRALDDASLGEATLQWDSPDRARIDTVAAPGQVVSVQVSYDPGWKATSGGKQLTVRPDALGMIVIQPAGAGPCRITLEFTGGSQRKLLLGVSLMTMLGLGLWGASSLRQGKPALPVTKY